MLFKAVGKALTREASGLRDEVRHHVESQMEIKRKGFLKSFRVKVLDQDPNRLSGMVIGSRIPWSGVESVMRARLPSLCAAMANEIAVEFRR
jgi:hypothetical protein